MSTQVETEVKVEIPESEVELAGQKIEIPEDKVVKTPTEETPKEDTSTEDFFAELFKDTATDADKDKEVEKETPTEDPFHNPEKKSDIYEKQIADLQTDIKNSGEEFDKVKPLLESLEKNPNLKKFVEAVSSGKLTFEGVFQQFAEAQIAKTVKTTTTSTGDVPVQGDLDSRLNDISKSRRIIDNGKVT